MTESGAALIILASAVDRVGGAGVAGIFLQLADPTEWAMSRRIEIPGPTGCISVRQAEYARSGMLHSGGEPGPERTWKEVAI